MSERHSDLVQRLRATGWPLENDAADWIEQRQAIIDTWPTMGDGEPFRFGNVWSNDERGTYQWEATRISRGGEVAGYFHGQPHMPTYFHAAPHDPVSVKLCYSTREAAEKVRQG